MTTLFSRSYMASNEWCAASGAVKAARMTPAKPARRIVVMAVSHRRRGRVRAAPQVHRAQLVAPTRLQVEEQLRPVGRMPAEHHADDERAARHLVAEHLDLDAEVGFRHVAEQRRVGVALRGK